MFRIFNQYVSFKSFLLMLSEAGLIAFSLLCAVKLRFWNNAAEMSAYVAFPDFLVQISIVVIVCILCFYCNDLYDLSSEGGVVDRVLRIEQSLGAASLLLGLLYFLFPGLLLSRGVFVIGMLIMGGLVVLSRRVLDKAWQFTAPLQRVAILGSGPMAQEIARQINSRGDLNMKVAGFINPAGDSEGDSGPGTIFGFPVLGAGDEMEALAIRHELSRIIVALEDRRGRLPIKELVTLRVSGLRVDDAPTALSALTGRVSLKAVKPSWFVFSDGFHRSKWNEVLKRSLDLFFGMIGLVLSSPVMMIVAAAIRLDSEGPSLYRQTRVGHKGKCFDVIKFRSMRTDAEVASGAQWATENDPRVTRLGRTLRKYRLDELPQFWNVIRGEMSFVGPRPERPYFVNELRQKIPYYDERHSVRPGLTGWAQVQYSYGASVEDAFNKLEYDLFYLQNTSLLFDLAIIFRTIKIVLGGHGGR